MKHSRQNVERRAHAIPRIKFEQQRLTSFAGLVLVQSFLAAIDFKAGVTSCFRHVRSGKIYARATVFLQLVVHLVLGYRDLRESAYYRDDPMVKRLLGLRRLPDVATLSRVLKDADQQSVERLRHLLRRMIADRRRWRCFDAERSFFENHWRPKSWTQSYRFVFIRKRVARRRKGPVQLDLFVPHERGFEFKVIITNKRVGVGTVLRFHEGRGAQEGIFGELKTHCAMGHVPVRRRLGNQMYLLAGLFAHNLVRELQMRTATRTGSKLTRGTTDNRAALWKFETVDTVRKTLLQRAGHLTRPSGTLTLTISAAGTVKEKLLTMLARPRPAA
jgi:hypothetical protein